MQISTICRDKLKRYIPQLPEKFLSNDTDLSTALVQEDNLKPLVILLHAILVQSNG